MSKKEPANEFTKRVMASLVVDVSLMREDIERVRIQVFAMAREHGIKIPAAAS